MEKKFEAHGILSGAAWLTFAAVFVKFMGLMYKIPLAHILTDEGMGYFNAAYTIYSLLYLLGTAGVPKAITVLISGCVSDVEKEKQRIFSVAARFFFVLGVFSFFLLMLFSRPISHWIGSPDAYPTILLISPCLLFSAVGGVYRGYLTAEGNFAATAISSAIEACAKLFLGIAFIWLARTLKMSLPWVCAFAVLGIGMGTFFSTLYLRFHVKNENNSNKAEQFLKTEQKEIIKRVLRIAIPITLGSLAAGLSSLIDLSMIIKRLTFGGLSVKQATAMYGNYTALAVPMLQLASALLAPISVVLLPRLASAFAQGNRLEWTSALRFGTDISAFFSIPLAFVFFFFPKQLLSLLFPLESAESAAPLLRLLSIGVVAISVLFIFNTALEAIGKARLQMISMLVGVAIKIPISYFLLGRAEYGIAGAPIGTVASYVASFLFSYFCLLKIFGGATEFFSSYHLPLINAVFSVLCAFFSFKLLGISPDNGRQGIVLLFIFAAAYVTFSYFTGVLRLDKIKKIAKQTKGNA